MIITALGDSFTEGFLVEETNYARLLQKAGFKLTNLGLNGSRTDDMLKRYTSYLARGNKEDVLIIFGGSNDFFQAKSVEFVVNNLKSILELSTASKKIIISPPFVEEEEAYPFYGQINEKIRSLYKEIEKMDADYLIDASKIEGHYLDGVHLAGDFHKNLAGEIEKILGEESGKCR